MSNSCLRKKKCFIHPSCYIKDSFCSHLMTFWIFGRLSFLGSWKGEFCCKRSSKMKKQEGILWHVSNGCFQEVLSDAKDTYPYAVCTFLNKVLEGTLFLYRLNIVFYIFYTYSMLLHKWFCLVALLVHVLFVTLGSTGKILEKDFIVYIL